MLSIQAPNICLSGTAHITIDLLVRRDDTCMSKFMQVWRVVPQELR